MLTLLTDATYQQCIIRSSKKWLLTDSSGISLVITMLLLVRQTGDYAAGVHNCSQPSSAELSRATARNTVVWSSVVLLILVVVILGEGRSARNRSEIDVIVSIGGLRTKNCTSSIPNHSFG